MDQATSIFLVLTITTVTVSFWIARRMSDAIEAFFRRHQFDAAPAGLQISALFANCICSSAVLALLVRTI